MASLVIKNDADALTAVFQPITVDYQWEFPDCLVYDASGALGIRVDLSFLTDVPIGEFVQVLNGSYKGTYQVVSRTSDASYVYIVTDGTWGGSDLTSNLFNVDKRQSFELYAGYQSGVGATVKPYQKIADIAVAINPQTALFEVDLQAYLRTYFSIDSPVSGIDYGLSLAWDLVSTTGTVATESDITWELALSGSVSIGLNITVDGVEQVNQLTSTSGSFTSLSSQNVQINGFRVIKTVATGTATATLTVTNTTTASVVYTETINITGAGETVSFAYTIAENTDYDILLETSL